MKGNKKCGGKNQSPISLQSSEASYSRNMDGLLVSGYSKKLKSMELVNNGHTGINDTTIAKEFFFLFNFELLILEYVSNSFWNMFHTQCIGPSYLY